MKILILSHEYPPVGGGGANACFHLAREYAAQGHSVRIVTVWYPGEEERTEEHIADGSVIVHRLRARREHRDHSSFAEMLDYLRKAGKFADMLERELRFDVCQVFFGIPSGPIALRLKSKYGLTYIVRLGGGDIPGAQKRYALLYKLLAPVVRHIWHQAEAVVANSSGLRRRAEAFDSRKEITVICNGVDLDYFQQTDASDDEQSRTGADTVFRLLFVSRLIEGKGLQDIIPQIPVIEEKTGRKLCLTIIGDGPYRDALERLTREVHAENSVVFTGAKEHAELPVYYHQADLFVFPSRSEGMPNVVLEAMACGLPILMTPCEGSAELINGNGYAIEVKHFPRVMAEMIESEEKRRLFCARSKQMVHDYFQWNQAAAKYLSIFLKSTGLS